MMIEIFLNFAKAVWLSCIFLQKRTKTSAWRRYEIWLRAWLRIWLRSWP